VVANFPGFVHWLTKAVCSKLLEEEQSGCSPQSLAKVQSCFWGLISLPDPWMLQIIYVNIAVFVPDLW